MCVLYKVEDNIFVHYNLGIPLVFWVPIGTKVDLLQKVITPDCAGIEP